MLILLILSGQTAGADEPAGDPDAWIGTHLLAEAADYTVFLKQEEQLTELALALCGHPRKRRNQIHNECQPRHSGDILNIQFRRRFEFAETT
jgi:hypothetical protein